MRTGLCLFDAYTTLAAQLGEGDAPAEPCDDSATHTVVMQHAGDGLTVRVDVEACAHHQAVLFGRPGYDRSIRIRRRT